MDGEGDERNSESWLISQHKHTLASERCSKEILQLLPPVKEVAMEKGCDSLSQNIFDGMAMHIKR